MAKHTCRPANEEAEFQWPEWLESAMVSDALLAEAYEATPASARCAIKTGLALAAFHFGQITGFSRIARRQAHLGFQSETVSRPAPWTIIAFSASYSAAARLSAACVQPVLADVNPLGAFCVGGAPTPQAMISLELCGVEDVFQLEKEKLIHTLSHLLNASQEKGRLILLHEGELEDVSAFARKNCLPFYEESRRPDLLLLSPELFSAELLKFSHGFIPCAAEAMAAHPDAVYADEAPASAAGARNIDAPLILAPGCEGFWLFPGLEPDFFKNFRSAFGRLQ